MKKILLGSALAALLSSSAYADSIGVTMRAFDDNYLTVLRNVMQDYAGTLDGVQIQVEDATSDVTKQQSQLQNFIASGSKAVILNLVDSNAGKGMSQIASDAGVPLVYINVEPANSGELPEKQVYIASDEIEAGTLQTKEVCRILKAAGKTEANVVIMIGDLAAEGARQRTQAAKDVMATPECSFMKLVEEQTAMWQRTQGADLVSNWLSAGVQFDAVIANNDEMAIGASQALKAAGVDMKDVVIAGVDATEDALAALKSGDIDVTVFQNAEGQGKGAVDAALKLIKGEKVEQRIMIPFELVTAENLDKYMK